MTEKITDPPKGKVRKVLHAINLPRILCDGLFGDEHSHHHRMATGAVVMGIGVFIAKSVGHVQVEIIAYLGDGIGYMIHGIGAIPFADYLNHIVKKGS